MKLYICVGDGPVVGPVRLDQVIRGLAVGKVPTDAVACREGESEWHPVAKLVALGHADEEDEPRRAVTPPHAEQQSPRPALVPARCPECGADIQVPADRDVAHCMYCGRSILVSGRSNDRPSNVPSWMTLADTAVKAGNHEEAYKWFTKVVEAEPSNHEAWYGRAIAAGWSSSLLAGRFGELLVGIEKAMSVAPSVERNALAVKAASDIAEITTALYAGSLEHTMEFIALDDSWKEHLDRCLPMLDALAEAHRLDPNNRDVLDDAIELSRSLIEGIAYDDPYDTYDDGRPRRKVRRSYDYEDVLRARLAEFEGARKQLDPNYAPVKIEKARSESTVSALFGCATILVVVGLSAGGIWKLVNVLRGDATVNTASPVAASSPAPAAPIPTTSPASMPSTSPSTKPSAKAPSAMQSSSMSAPKKVAVMMPYPGGTLGAVGRQLRTRCPAGTVTISPYRFGCACFLADGSRAEAPEPPVRECEQMPGAIGMECVWTCKVEPAPTASADKEAAPSPPSEFKDSPY